MLFRKLSKLVDSVVVVGEVTVRGCFIGFVSQLEISRLRVPAEHVPRAFLIGLRLERTVPNIE